MRICEEVQKWTKNLAHAQAEQENINQELTAAKGNLKMLNRL